MTDVISEQYLADDHSVRSGLIALQRLFAGESRWTQRTSARNGLGYYINASHPSATCWCLTGGCRVVMITVEQYSDMIKTLAATILDLSRFTGKGFEADNVVIQYNDDYTRTFSDILDLIQRTLDRLGEHPGQHA